MLEAFEAAVLAFPGPVLLISHDRWLLNRFGGAIWRLEDGALREEEAQNLTPGPSPHRRGEGRAGARAAYSLEGNGA